MSESLKSVNKTETDIKQGLNEIFSAMLKSKNKEVEITYGEVMQQLLRDYGKEIKKMDTFYILIQYSMEEALEYLVRLMYPNLTEKTTHDIIFLYTHYDFYEHQVEGLIYSREGFVCVSDKTKWLLNSYLRYLLEEKVPDMNREAKCFWKPHFGTGDEWISFIESLMPFYYGKPAAYLKCMAGFVQTAKEDE